MHFDAYRIKPEEWHTGTRINIKLILTIPYNNDDVDMDPSMALVSNTQSIIAFLTFRLESKSNRNRYGYP